MEKIISFILVFFLFLNCSADSEKQELMEFTNKIVRRYLKKHCPYSLPRLFPETADQDFPGQVVYNNGALSILPDEILLSIFEDLIEKEFKSYRNPKVAINKSIEFISLISLINKYHYITHKPPTYLFLLKLINQYVIRHRFFEACKKGNEYIVEYLIANNMVDVNACDQNGNLPLILAIRSKRKKIMEILVKYADVNVQDKHGENALMVACRKADTSFLELLLKNGATKSINVQNLTGWTPLMIAVTKKRSKLVKILLKAGAKIDMVNKSGESASSIAERKCLERICNLLSTNCGNLELDAKLDSAFLGQNQISILA